MTAPDPIAEKIEREDRERTDRQRAAWDKLFAEWLTNRATYIDPNVTFEKTTSTGSWRTPTARSSWHD